VSSCVSSCLSVVQFCVGVFVIFHFSFCHFSFSVVVVFVFFAFVAFVAFVTFVAFVAFALSSILSFSRFHFLIWEFAVCSLRFAPSAVVFGGGWLVGVLSLFFKFQLRAGRRGRWGVGGE